MGLLRELLERRRHCFADNSTHITIGLTFGVNNNRVIVFSHSKQNRFASSLTTGHLPINRIGNFLKNLGWKGRHIISNARRGHRIRNRRRR